MEGDPRLPLPKGSYRKGDGWGAPRDGGKRKHQGLDLSAPAGTPVFAWGPGQVTHSFDANGGGNIASVSHGAGLVTKYMHLSGFTAPAGTRVAAGQQIGTVGSTGRSSGPHLHFAVAQDGVYVPPEPFWNDAELLAGALVGHQTTLGEGANAIVSAAPDPFGVIDDTKDAIVAVARAIAAGVEVVTGVAEWLTDPANWRRIGITAVGAALVYAGARLVLFEEGRTLEVKNG